MNLSEAIERGVTLYQQAPELLLDQFVDPVRLAYVGCFERSPNGSGDIYQAVAHKVRAALGIWGTTLDNPVTGNTRYWYHTLGELYDVQLWTVAQIVEWLQENGL